MQSKPQQPTKRHHYIPEFYTRYWAGSAGTLTEYRRGRAGKVVARETAPAGTGYLMRLYEMEGFASEAAQSVEHLFFKPVDTLAASVLHCMVEYGEAAEYSYAQRMAWSRFLLSLSTRAPNDINAMRSYWQREVMASWSDEDRVTYDLARGEGDPVSLEEFARSFPRRAMEHAMFETLLGSIETPKVLRDLSTMHWTIMTSPENELQFLTSDRPLTWSDKFGSAGGHAALPIGPRKLFIAARDREFLQRLRASRVRDLIAHANSQVVERADRYVYGADDRQIRFVQNRMGTRPHKSWIQEVVENRARTAASRRVS